MQVRFFLISAVVCGQVGAATLHFNNTTGGTDYGFELDDQALTIKFDPVTLGGTPYDSGILQQTVTGFVGFTPVNIIQTVRVHGVLPVLQVDSLGPFQMTVGSPYWDISGTQSDAFRAELPEMISLQADWTMSHLWMEFFEQVADNANIGGADGVLSYLARLIERQVEKARVVTRQANDFKAAHGFCFANDALDILHRRHIDVARALVRHRAEQPECKFADSSPPERVRRRCF